MDNADFGQHIFQPFNVELEELRSMVSRAGGLVESQLGAALEALATGDGDRAEQVVAGDREINLLEVEIDELCAKMLARHQPLARDLRLIIAVIKATTDLERMGDEAVRIARMAVRISDRDGGASRPGHRHDELRHLGVRVREMLHDALDAFARIDLELSGKIISDDVAVDREYESITREQITFMMQDPRAIPRALDVMFSARALERVGDRACNIAEYVIYLAKGKDLRHTTIETRLNATGQTR